MNILIMGALYGILYGIILAMKNKEKFVEKAHKINKERKVVVMKAVALIFAVMSVLMTTYMDVEFKVKLMMGTLAVLLLMYPYLTILIKAVEKSCLMKFISVNKLTPGDWVEQDVYKNKKMIYKRKPLGIEHEDIVKLMKAKIGKVLVKEGIPFIPPFFIGTLVSVLTGKILGIM